MRSEKSRKHTMKKKEAEPAPSGFLSGAISQLLAGNTMSTTPPALDDDLKRALQKYRAPEKVERLESEVASTRSDLAAIKRLLAPGKEHILRRLISAVKKNYPDRASDQRYIAARVDKLLKDMGKALADVCPKDWKVPGLPDLLLVALQDDGWKGRVSQYISKSPAL